MPNELKTAEQLLEQQPDSAYRMLQKISPDKYQSGAARALYGLLMIETLDKKMLPLKPDSLLDYSIAYYEEHPDKDRLATCYLYKGRSYKYVFLYEKAIEFYLKALDEAAGYKNNMLLGRIYFDLGDIYNIQRDYTLARQKYKTAYSFFKKENSQVLAFYSLLNIGRTYHAAGSYQLAQSYYPKILRYAKDSLQKGALYQEMGLNFYDSKKPDSALVYYRQIINYPYIANNRAIRYYFLSDLFFDLEQPDSAYYYAIRAFNYNPDIRTQRECYRVLANCASTKKNMEDIKKYIPKYQDCSDSIRKIDAQTKGSFIETMHSAKKEAIKSNSRFSIALVLLMCVVASGLVFYYLKHSKNLKEKKLLEESHVQQKAGIRKDVMRKYSENLLHKIETLKAKRANERKKASHAENVLQDRKIYDELLQIHNPELFFSEMDSVLNNLVSKLKKQYPSLTTKEISWCCLTLLNIPTTDIYLLLDYTVDGLKSMRKRLANKVNLKGVSELNDFLIRMLAE
ncbi:hypothetical protein Palpr_0872 [Paludibacter propionicigenes WB4]|uniref:Uncharacterized protein n=1 Tax=Paludibacter propionicigenes (strain DSM 17365 / JCM 13257 / WB4) TaxID=694427 RepID=E4T2T0_PALPW|nr:tetratricopeptide repeat protein [Paludibacter propionicigenes]ADQ79024.1 hypothetical protein Palpr_0872 [Paludibacter propionicigenes WB4]